MANKDTKNTKDSGSFMSEAKDLLSSFVDKQKDKETTTTDSRGQQLDKEVENAKESFTETSMNAISSVKNAKSQLENVEDQVFEANAEEQAQKATTQGGVVGISDALEMVETERNAKKMEREAAMSYMSTAATSLASVASGAAKVAKQAANDIAYDAKEEGGGWGALLAGTAFTAIGGFLGLQANNESEVEEKFIDGFNSPEQAAIDVYDTVNPEGNGYDEGVGPDATEEKTVEGDDGYVPDDSNDATSITESELDDFANLDALAKLFGVDDVKDIKEDLKEIGIDEQHEFEDLNEAIVTGVVPEAFGKAIGPAGSELIGNLAKLYDEMKEMDERAEQAEADGPDYQ